MSYVLDTGRDIIGGVTGKTGAKAASDAANIQSAASKEAAGITSEAALKVAEMQAQSAREAGGIASGAYTQASQMQAQAIKDAAAIQQASQLEAAGLLSESQKQALAIQKQQFAANEQRFNQLYTQLAPAQQTELQGLQRQENVLGGQAQLATGAQGQLGNLLGLNGAEQQQQAQGAILDSPAMQALRERAANLTTRSSAAIGGLGGGNIRSELFSQNRALDQNAINNQIATLSGVSQMGAQGIGMNATNIGVNTAGNQIAAGTNYANTLGGLTTDIGQTQAGGVINAANANAYGVGGAGEALAGGVLGAGTARANALTGVSNALGQGQLTAADALAGGLTGAAQANASGLLGAAQAKAQGAQNLIKIGAAVAGGM